MPLFGQNKKEYQRQWLAKRREEFFGGKSCVKCGSKLNLELDHIDPDKKISHHIWSWSKERREQEIEKCQILCKFCHKYKTKQELTTKQHGFTMYSNHGCRCDFCCESLRQHWRDYRKRKKNSSVV